jgi:hypothetical protein
VRPRKRDRSFLVMAALAGTGGLLAVGMAIGLPIWRSRHGLPYTPEFSLFAAWGFAALAGAYACLKTYFITDPPRRPPHGGLPLTVLHGTSAVAAERGAPATERRAA